MIAHAPECVVHSLLQSRTPQRARLFVTARGRPFLSSVDLGIKDSMSDLHSGHGGASCTAAPLSPRRPAHEPRLYLFSSCEVSPHHWLLRVRKDGLFGTDRSRCALCPLVGVVLTIAV
jgi:hypothetical protein